MMEKEGWGWRGMRGRERDIQTGRHKDGQTE